MSFVNSASAPVCHACRQPAGPCASPCPSPLTSSHANFVGARCGGSAGHARHLGNGHSEGVGAGLRGAGGQRVDGSGGDGVGAAEGRGILLEIPRVAQGCGRRPGSTIQHALERSGQHNAMRGQCCAAGRRGADAAAGTGRVRASAGGAPLSAAGMVKVMVIVSVVVTREVSGVAARKGEASRGVRERGVTRRGGWEEAPRRCPCGPWLAQACGRPGAHLACRRQGRPCWWRGSSRQQHQPRC